VGFFGDMNKLRAMGEESQQNMDVKARMADAKTRMDAANAHMQAMTAAAVPSDPASEARRIAAAATVISARQTGLRVNLSLEIELSLLVMLPSGIPLPVHTAMLVPELNLSRVQPGGQVNVTIDPETPASVRVNWNA
jgi:hypothetical protein